MVNPKLQYNMYAVAGCSNDNVDIELIDKKISKEALSYIIITIDVITILCSVFYIWFLEHNIEANLNVNDLLTLETREFALTF